MAECLPNINTFYTQEQKEKLINAEIAKLKKMFDKMGKGLYERAKSLVNKVAFMSVSLDDLQEIINQKGYVEPYQNGENQWGYKRTSEIDVYNSMIRNYVAASKQLCDMIPESTDEKDALTEFLKRGKK